MLLHLTTLLQLMLMPHTLANNDIQTSAIIHLSLLKLYSKFRINSRFKGKMHAYPRILPKNERTNSFLVLLSKKTEFIRSFFLEDSEDIKSHFEIL